MGWPIGWTDPIQPVTGWSVWLHMRGELSKMPTLKGVLTEPHEQENSQKKGEAGSTPVAPPTSPFVSAIVGRLFGFAVAQFHRKAVKLQEPLRVIIIGGKNDGIKGRAGYFLF